MSFLRLALCVSGVYAMFLLWAIAQERLSVPFARRDGGPADRFQSPVFMGTCQSALSAFAALLYILLRRGHAHLLGQALGLEHQGPNLSRIGKQTGAEKQQNGVRTANGRSNDHHPKTRHSSLALLFRYLQCSIFITCAAPFGFAALMHISYPAMVLGKSCKLVPVMIMNVLLYRRRFAPHKYLVVGMVTAGITLFMWAGGEKKGRHGGGVVKGRADEGTSAYAGLIGCMYLLINLALDGATNSTQDEIFARHGVTGQQMMFWINSFCTLLTVALGALPLPHIPVIHPSVGGVSEFADALAFIRAHPDVVGPLAQFAFTGALGQLFIFETLQHFGSLTLVTITLTRKLFTMLLSVIVYKHKLSPGQWLGAGVVFAGISVEAFVKRKDVHARRVIQEKEKATIKSL